MLRRSLVLAAALLAASCGDDGTNPFARFTQSRPPSADAVLLFLSGSWATEPGAPRELFALNADGSKPEQLTSCADAEPACDFLSVSPSPDSNRVVAVRTTPTAEEGASTLYFMDLARAVETVVFPNRRVGSADYSPDGGFILFSALFPQTSQEDLFLSQPDGKEEQNLTQTLDVRELKPRVDPSSRTAVFERIDASGVSRLYIYPSTPLTSGTETGEALPGTPYVVGADADGAFSPDGLSMVYRRLTGTGNGGLGTWDVLTLRLDGASAPLSLATGPLHRGAPDWGSGGILFVETDAARSVSQLVRLAPDGTGRTVLRTEDAGYRMAGPRWLRGR
jgi:Tol biopolymer transport system component